MARFSGQIFKLKEKPYNGPHSFLFLCFSASLELSMPSADDRIRKTLIHQLESLSRAGITDLPRLAPAPLTPPPSKSPSKATPREPESLPRKTEPMPPSSSSKPSRSKAAPLLSEEPIRRPRSRKAGAAHSTLALLEKEVSQCTLCSELAATRTQTVFGEGNPEARLCFLGEAPGADEDQQGKPFVGRSGKLLTKIIEDGMGLQRSEIYILNLLKCRPPGNRNPEPDEIAHCRPHFERQLEIIAPEFICCVGAFASKTLLQSEETIGKLRGRWHQWRGIPVIATYHPAYLLRNPSAKQATWEDIQMLMEKMGIQR